jgi:hypothetical protein
VSGFNSLEASTVVRAPAVVVFDEVCNIEGRVRDVPAFQRVDINERSDNGFVATMYESYGGHDLVITSRFRFERPNWVTYEHINGPSGQNRGRFTIRPTPRGTLLHQVHETLLDIAEGSTLRGEWLQLMKQQLDAIRIAAEGRVASA